MIYKAYLKQAGEGCDYTIGCGQTIIDIKASNIKEAKEQLYRLIAEDYVDDKELESFEIYEINQIESNFNLKDWYSTQEVIKEMHQEDLEYKEYERLKAKFEKQI